jgi:AAA domain
MPDGVDRAELVSWLLGPWREDGPGVCVVEGFNGVGKTSAAQRVMRTWSSRSVLVTAEQDFDLLSLMLGIADKLHLPDDYIDADVRRGLLRLLENGALIVIDEFDSLLSADTRLPSREFMEFVADAGKLSGSGRLLLTTAQSPALGSWMDGVTIKTMVPPKLEDAEAMLEQLLSDRHQSHDVPREQYGEIVSWLGRNPRAIQAFVACLRDDPLSELISLGTDLWELRYQGATPQMVERLEKEFLRKTISRLDPVALQLLEQLSVHRGRFTIDVINAAAPKRISPKIPREALTSRFILDRAGTQYSLNPLARQLAFTRLTDRRKTAAHKAAADYYKRRVNPTTEQGLARAGADFVEARFHLLSAGSESEFQDLAGNYRRWLLKMYKDLDDVPTQPGVAPQLLATLMAALYDVDGGHASLRMILAQLLEARGGPGDNELAYRQISIATRHTRDVKAWLLRMRLAVRVQTSATVAAIAGQAIDRLDPAAAAAVALVAVQGLAARRDPRRGLEVVGKGLKQLPVTDRLELYSAGAFLLSRQNNKVQAINLLLEGYMAAGPALPDRSRLFEQAAFFAFEKRDVRVLGEIKSMVADEGNKNHQVLCDVLEYELAGHYATAAALAGKYQDDDAVAAQGAFCFLTTGQPGKAKTILDRASRRRKPANRADHWLRGVCYGALGDWPAYAEGMRKASAGRKLTDVEAFAPDRWIRVWESVRDRLGAPSFYFPRLPAALTGLSRDLDLPANGLSATERFPDHNFALNASYSRPEHQGKPATP